LSRGPTTFRQRDVTAAVKAVVNAGLKIARVEVSTKTGNIAITPGEPNRCDLQEETNDWEDAK
jgi:hypothetical protein